MLSLGPQFSHYGLTGGFLLFAQFFLFFIVLPEHSNSIVANAGAKAAKLLSSIPTSLEIGTTAIFAVIFILMCFLAGMILETIGSIFAVKEAKILNRNLERYKSCLIPIFNAVSSLAIKDLEEIAAEFSEMTKKARQLHAFFFYRLFWQKAAWQVLHKRFFTCFKILPACSRIEALLVSYSLASNKGSIIDLLRDKIHLCHIARAITVTLFILCYEIAFFYPYLADYNTRYFFPWLISAISLLWLSVLITDKTYSRFCDSLFSTVIIESHDYVKKSNSD